MSHYTAMIRFRFRDPGTATRQALSRAFIALLIFLILYPTATLLSFHETNSPHSTKHLGPSFDLGDRQVMASESANTMIASTAAFPFQHLGPRRMVPQYNRDWLKECIYQSNSDRACLGGPRGNATGLRLDQSEVTVLNPQQLDRRHRCRWRSGCRSHKGQKGGNIRSIIIKIMNRFSDILTRSSEDNSRWSSVAEHTQQQSPNLKNSTATSDSATHTLHRGTTLNYKSFWKFWRPRYHRPQIDFVVTPYPFSGVVEQKRNALEAAGQKPHITNQANTNRSTDGDTAGIIAGIALGSIVVLGSVIGFTLCCIWNKTRCLQYRRRKWPSAAAKLEETPSITRVALVALAAPAVPAAANAAVKNEPSPGAEMVQHRPATSPVMSTAPDNTVMALDGCNDGWTQWILHKRASGIERAYSPTPRTRPPQIPALRLPKPSFATIRKASGLGPDLEDTTGEPLMADSSASRGVTIRWDVTP